jgi:hypothetical protein
MARSKPEISVVRSRALPDMLPPPVSSRFQPILNASPLPTGGVVERGNPTDTIFRLPFIPPFCWHTMIDQAAVKTL